MATDLGPASAAALAEALELARTWRASLRLLHVLPPPESEAGLHTLEAADRRLRALVPPGADCAISAVFGAPADTIVAEAAAGHADLIVLGARPAPAAALYTGWAVAYRVLGHAPCPVLTVRG